MVGPIFSLYAFYLIVILARMRDVKSTSGRLMHGLFEPRAMPPASVSYPLIILTSAIERFHCIPHERILFFNRFSLDEFAQKVINSWIAFFKLDLFKILMSVFDECGRFLIAILGIFLIGNYFDDRLKFYVRWYFYTTNSRDSWFIHVVFVQHPNVYSCNWDIICWFIIELLLVWNWIFLLFISLTIKANDGYHIDVINFNGIAFYIKQIE